MERAKIKRANRRSAPAQIRVSSRQNRTNHTNVSLIHRSLTSIHPAEIILGILLSVVVAFSIGALVQYVSRLLLSFKFKDKAS